MKETDMKETDMKKILLILLTIISPISTELNASNDFQLDEFTFMPVFEKKYAPRLRAELATCEDFPKCERKTKTFLKKILQETTHRNNYLYDDCLFSWAPTPIRSMIGSFVEDEFMSWFIKHDAQLTANYITMDQFTQRLMFDLEESLRTTPSPFGGNEYALHLLNQKRENIDNTPNKIFFLCILDKKKELLRSFSEQSTPVKHYWSLVEETLHFTETPAQRIAGIMAQESLSEDDSRIVKAALVKLKNAYDALFEVLNLTNVPHPPFHPQPLPSEEKKEMARRILALHEGFKPGIKVPHLDDFLENPFLSQRLWVNSHQTFGSTFYSHRNVLYTLLRSDEEETLELLIYNAVSSLLNEIVRRPE